MYNLDLLVQKLSLDRMTVELCYENAPRLDMLVSFIEEIDEIC